MANRHAPPLGLSGAREPRHFGSVVGAFVGLCALTGATLVILRVTHSQGIGPTGDEPHYLVAALAIGRFHTLQVGAAYRFAVAHNTFITWPHPPPEQVVAAHGGLFAYHEPGLSILLALPVAVAGLHGAYAGLVLMVGVLTVWLCYLVGRLSSLRSPWHLAIVGIFLSPAYLLASTAVYPDLVSGLLIAIVIALTAGMELDGRSTWARLLCCGLLLGYLPWLHIQNALAAALLAVALVGVTWWHRLRILPVVVGLSIAALGWGLMAFYDDYVFGRPQGPADQVFSWGAIGWTRVLALLVDRQQGLFVQFPVIVLGIAALWSLRKRFPISALATGAVCLVVIVLSGSSGNSFGGESFVGRFNWAVCPVLLGFAGLYLVELSRKHLGLTLGIGAVIAVLYALQLVPIVDGDHSYYSTSWLTPLRPPGPAWWGPLDHLLPSFASLSGAWRNTRVIWGVAFLLVLAVLLVYMSASSLSGSTHLRASIAGILLVGSVVALSGTTASASEKSPPMFFTPAGLSSQVGRVVGESRTVHGSRSQGTLIYGPYWVFPSGSYRETISYSLEDPNPGAASADAHITRTAPAHGVATLVQKTLFPARHGTAVLRFEIRYQGLLEMRVFWKGTGTLTVDSIELQDLSGL